MVLETCLLVHALLALRTLEVAPPLKLLLGNIKRLWYFLRRDNHITERTALTAEVLGDITRDNMEIAHRPSGAERRFAFAAYVERLRSLVRVIRDHEISEDFWLYYRQSRRQYPTRNALFEVPALGCELSVNINTLAALRETVLSAVDHTPFNGVAKIRQA